MAVISKGITLSYKQEESVGYKALTNLQEIPELGGDVEAIEITTLADAAHTYTDGLISYGDSLAFKFLYDVNQYEVLLGFGILHSDLTWQVKLPDGTACEFTGGCSVKLDGVGTNAVLTYTLNIKPTSQMEWIFDGE